MSARTSKNLSVDEKVIILVGEIDAVFSCKMSVSSQIGKKGTYIMCKLVCRCYMTQSCISKVLTPSASFL